jgi:hypothetical protein
MALEFASEIPYTTRAVARDRATFCGPRFALAQRTASLYCENRPGGVIGDAINASGNALDPRPLCQPCQDRVGESSLSSLFRRHEAVIILGDSEKFVKTGVWHSSHCDTIGITAATAALSICFHYGTILTDPRFTSTAAPGIST